VSKDLGWAEALDRLMSRQVETVPPAYKTPKEIANQLGICEEMAKLKAKELVKAGLAERKDFRVRWGKGIRATPHYRLVNCATRASNRRSGE